ncbi:MAG: YdcF family protein [Alphaproteobacteria bacterium]|nr:YdcF family protein [Alphaproteobacteria bacterium]
MTFLLSKILWMLIAPATLLTLALGVGLALQYSIHPSLKEFGQILCFFVFFAMLSLALLPVGSWALIPLENSFAFFPPERVDGVIVLGGDEQADISFARGQPTALDSMRRYVRFAELAQRYPEAKLAFTGGSAQIANHIHTPESEIARQIMSSIGVPTDRMTFERLSRNTHENATFLFDALEPRPGENWLLVTSAYHMPRAMGCFRKAGWNVYAAPTGYFTTGHYGQGGDHRLEEQLRYLTIAAHEYVGLVSYWIMGRTDALWPQ